MPKGPKTRLASFVLLHVLWSVVAPRLQAQQAETDTPFTAVKAKQVTPGTPRALGSDAYAPFVPPPASPEGVTGGSAAAQAVEEVKGDIGSQVFFDAKHFGLNQNLKRQEFEGDVVAIAAGTLIAADSLTYDKGSELVQGKGHVIILSRNMLFLGDQVTYHLATSDFEISNAVMRSNDQAEIDQVVSKIFGFTPRELAFEAARKSRLSEIDEQKAALKRQVDQNPNVTDPKILEPLVDSYALLLDKAELIRRQENPNLARLSEERRTAFKKRRAFWDASQHTVIAMKGAGLASTYLHLDGDTLSRINGNDYVARNALFTPCRCQTGEDPAWAFRADEVDAQMGGYADLYHAVLEIHGIPVLYLPELKLPIKDKRQSGFLMPTVGFQQRSGNTFTQPVYFALAPNADATVTSDIYENRGTRLGVEYRAQQREFSGWELRLEGIRDQLWMADRTYRQELSEFYQQGLAAAASGKSPDIATGLSDKEYTRQYLQRYDYWKDVAGFDPQDPTKVAAAKQSIDSYLSVPGNSWRGAYAWRGVSFLAPRLSFVSDGQITSDHRYVEELYVPDDFNQAFYGSREAQTFATARGQLNLDGKDFYLSLGSRYGDNYLENERFEGQQLPLAVKAQSRYLALVPSTAKIPIYGELTGEQIRISEFKAENPDLALGRSLGDGNWQRVKLQTVSPWITNSIVQMHQFTDVETRSIVHSGLSALSSSIRSWRTGVEFSLPIDGKGELPAMLQPPPCADQPPVAPGLNSNPMAGVAATGAGAAATSAVPTSLPGTNVPAAPASNVLHPAAFVATDCLSRTAPDGGRRFVHHVIDNRLRISLRPSVVRRGPYTVDTDAAGDKLAYFATDIGPPLGALAASDSDIPEEERMHEHQRVSFSTDHVFKLFTRSWQPVPGVATSPIDGKDTSVKDQARRELLRGLDRQIGGSKDLYDETNKQWLIDRYKLTETGSETPLTLHADVAYDFLDAKARADEIAANAAPGSTPTSNLSEAWKPVNLALGINHADWQISGSGSYSTYGPRMRSEAIGVGTPTVLKTSLGAGYQITNTYDSASQSFPRATIRSASLDSTFIPAVKTFVRVNRKSTVGSPETYTSLYQTAYGAAYASPSDCWGLQFSREKDYGALEADAIYVLRLSMIFMGQERPLPDMSGGALRESQSQRRF